MIHRETVEIQGLLREIHGAIGRYMEKRGYKWRYRGDKWRDRGDKWRYREYIYREAGEILKR